MNRLLTILAILCCVGVIQTDCSWGSWSSCSHSCGGGTRYRTGTCSIEGGWQNWVYSVQNKRDTSNCSEICHMDGRYYGGRCQCPPRRTGRCCDDYKPCSESNGGCADTCRMVTQDSRNVSRCGCRQAGYQLSMDGRTCIDINECALGRCNHTCRNTPGSFVCSCRSGYTLAADGTTCNDTNECTTHNGGCSHTCVNELGSFHCDCPSGYRLDPDGHTCQDNDECTANTTKCENTCVNIPGSFRCGCENGYRLDTNGYSCKDTNECAKQNGGCSHVCVNDIGSYHCVCPSGYRIAPDGHTCQAYYIEGQRVTLTCSITNDIPEWTSPTGRIINFSGSSSVVNSFPHRDRFSVSPAGDLIIDNLKQADSGQYTCSYPGSESESTNLLMASPAILG